MRIRCAIISLGFTVSLFFTFSTVYAQSADRIAIVAASPEEVRQQAAVFAFLQEYFSALAEGQVDKIATYHPALTPDQLDTLRNYFAHTIRDLHIRLEDVHVQVTSNRADVVFNRTDRFVDQETSRPVKKSAKIKTSLIQNSSGWRMSGSDQIAFLLNKP